MKKSILTTIAKYLILSFLMIALGYTWRVFQEKDYRWEAYESGMKRILWDIKKEIPKGYNFSITVDDVTVDFMPRKDGKAVIRQAEIAGAGDQGPRKVWEEK